MSRYSSLGVHYILIWRHVIVIAHFSSLHDPARGLLPAANPLRRPITLFASVCCSFSPFPYWSLSLSLLIRPNVKLRRQAFSLGTAVFFGPDDDEDAKDSSDELETRWACPRVRPVGFCLHSIASVSERMVKRSWFEVCERRRTSGPVASEPSMNREDPRGGEDIVAGCGNVVGSDIV